MARASRAASPEPLLDRDGFLETWSRLHHFDARRANVFVRGWLAVVLAVSRPLARRGVAPDLVTLGSLVVAAGVPALAAPGGWWLVAAAALVLMSAVLDGVDGAVAVLTERESRWGYVLDSVVDRVSEALFLLALWAGGADGRLVVAAGVLVYLLEYTRARAGSAGGDGVGRITVAERPQRVIVLVFGLLAGPFGSGLLSVAAGVLAALTVVGLVQLLLAVRRQLGTG